MHGRREKRSSEINRKVNVRSGVALQASSSSSPFGFLFCFAPPLFFCQLPQDIFIFLTKNS
jgi:hypothetical protein